MAALCCSVCAAQPSTEFSYARANALTDFYGLQNFQDDNAEVFCATKFDAAELAPFAGNRIGAVTVYSPTNEVVNPQTEVEVFVFEDELGGEPVSVQKGQLSATPKEANSIVLGNPVDIAAGKSYYVGYKLRVPSQPFYYMPVDLQTDVPNERCIYAVTYDGTYPAMWQCIGREYGNLCLGVTIMGDRLPDNWAVITSAAYPPSLRPGKPGSVEMTVENKGVATIHDLTVAIALPGGETAELTASPVTPIAPGTTEKVVFEELKLDAEGCFDLSAVIAQVNGKSAVENAQVKGEVMVFDGGYKRRMVMEEAGGTWCSWCPAGIVMVDNIKRDYPDDFLCISVHQGDAMELQAYYPFLVKYFTSFPASIINRSVQYDPASGHSVEFTRQRVKELYDYYTSFPAVADVDFSFIPTPDGKYIKLTANVEFALDLDKQYELSFVLTEDKVGPYMQNNAYGSELYGPMGGWENLDYLTEWTYNDVPRDLLGFPGIEGSLPPMVEKGRKYTYNCNLSLSRVTGSEWRVIALLTDAETGEIVNAREVQSDTYTAVNEATAGCEVNVTVKADVLTVTGASKVAVYGADGRLVSTAAVSRLTPGIYVVRADKLTRKVRVQ